jgi:hypothetical protein
MSLEELIARRYHGKIIPRKIPLSQEIKKNIYLLVFTLLFIIIILSIAFLLTTSGQAEQGNILQSIQSEKDQYTSQKRVLDDKILDAQSLKTIENSEKVQQMQKVEAPVYLEGNR